jgi:RecQ family ATP-dependent DNA helicase
MACTATATPQVILDIQTSLQLQHAPVHKGSFDRPNIFYKVKYKDCLDDPLQDLVQYIAKRHEQANNNANNKNEEYCSGIVYVHKRTDTTMLARAISRAGIRAEAYHAGLKDAQRTKVQEEWSNNTIQVVVATVAFGMGIDLAHVRYVIHWTMAKTVEGFYQESGRAGRDGLPSHSVLYYSKEDARKFQWLIGQQKKSKKSSSSSSTDAINLERKLAALEQMVDYCTTPACRRNALIRHFGGTTVDCQATCDYCKDPKKVERTIQSAAVLKDVKQQLDANKRFSKKSKQKQWDGQWKAPHGDRYDDDERDWGDDGMVGDLRVTDGVGNDGDYKKSKKSYGGFVKASSILSKYEVSTADACPLRGYVEN